MKDLRVIAGLLASKLKLNGFTEPYVQAMCLAEEAGEALGAYRRWSGNARRTGTKQELMSEIADTVISAYVFADFLGEDLSKAIDEKLEIIFTRGWREESSHGTGDEE